MTTTINASTSAGLISSADTSGILQLQTGNTAALTIDASQNVSLAVGSANGVTYLNGSKVLTSGSALTFDGTNLYMGATIGAKFALYQSGGSNIYGFGVESGALTFLQSSTEQMRLTSTGLGIGTSSPAGKLDVAGDMYVNNLPSSPTGGIYLGQSGYRASILWNVSTGNLDITPRSGFNTVFTAGNLGLGNASPTYLLDMYKTSRGSGANYSTSAMEASTICRVYGGENDLSKAATLTFTQFNASSAISSGYTATYASFLSFGTSNGSSGSVIERARIDSSGNLLVGTTSASAGNTFGSGVLARSTSKPLAAVCDASSGSASVGIGRTNSTGNYVEFYYGTGLTSSTGTISTNGTTTAYNTTSDQRLKENIADADSASSLIDSLQVRQFDWKADGSHQRYGFVAQELVTVAPEAVHQPEDTEQMMAVDYSKLVPMLVKEIQSLRQRLAAANL